MFARGSYECDTCVGKIIVSTKKLSGETSTEIFFPPPSLPILLFSLPRSPYGRIRISEVKQFYRLCEAVWSSLFSAHDVLIGRSFPLWTWFRQSKVHTCSPAKKVCPFLIAFSSLHLLSPSHSPLCFPSLLSCVCFTFCFLFFFKAHWVYWRGGKCAV